MHNFNVMLFHFHYLRLHHQNLQVSSPIVQGYVHVEAFPIPIPSISLVYAAYIPPTYAMYHIYSVGF